MKSTTQLYIFASIGILANIPTSGFTQDLRGILGKVQQLQQKIQNQTGEQPQGQPQVQPQGQPQGQPQVQPQAIAAESAPIQNPNSNQQSSRPKAATPFAPRPATSKAILSGWDELDYKHSPSIYLPTSLGGFSDARKIEVRYYLKTADGQPYQFGASHEVNCQTKQLRAIDISAVHLGHDQYPRVFFERPDFHPSESMESESAYPIYPAIVARACAENPVPKEEGYWDFSPAKQSQPVSEKFDIRGIGLGMSLQEVLAAKSIIEHKANRGSCIVSDPRTPHIETGASRHAFDFYVACDRFSYFDGISSLVVGFINGKSHYIGLNSINTYRENTNKSSNHVPPIVQTLSTDKMKSEPEISEQRTFESDIAIARGSRRIIYSWKNTSGEIFRILPSKVFKNIREKLPFNFPDMAITVISPDYVTLREQIISKAINQQERANKAASEKVKSNI